MFNLENWVELQLYEKYSPGWRKAARRRTLDQAIGRIYARAFDEINTYPAPCSCTESGVKARTAEVYLLERNRDILTEREKHVLSTKEEYIKPR